MANHNQPQQPPPRPPQQPGQPQPQPKPGQPSPQPQQPHQQGNKPLTVPPTPREQPGLDPRAHAQQHQLAPAPDPFGVLDDELLPGLSPGWERAEEYLRRRGWKEAGRAPNGQRTWYDPEAEMVRVLVRKPDGSPLVDADGREVYAYRPRPMPMQRLLLPTKDGDPLVVRQQTLPPAPWACPTERALVVQRGRERPAGGPDDSWEKLIKRKEEELEFLKKRYAEEKAREEQAVA